MQYSYFIPATLGEGWEQPLGHAQYLCIWYIIRFGKNIMAMIVWVGENGLQIEMDISPKPMGQSSWNFPGWWKTPPKIYLRKLVLLNCIKKKLQVINLRTCPYMVKSWISYWRFKLLTYMSKYLIHCPSEHIPVQIRRASLKGRAVTGDWFRPFIWIKYLLGGSKNTW